MKNILLLVFMIIFLSCVNKQKRIIVGNSEYQKELNATFKDASKSPLTKKDLKKFKGLDFFKIADKYKVTAKIVKTPNSPIFNFPTTTDRVVMYKKYGVVSFLIDEKKFQLNIYKEENQGVTYSDNLFLPFFDKTNGKTTYEGGRFIDIEETKKTKEGVIIIDFNEAYNPYCAYNNLYSCPITPRENYLDIEIKAGVMAYKK